jgi:hypothetical protein
LRAAGDDNLPHHEELLSPGAKEGSHSQIEKDDYDNGGNEELFVQWPMVPAGAVAPHCRSEDQYRQQEENANDFQPESAANFAKRAEKATDTARYISTGLACSGAGTAMRCFANLLIRLRMGNSVCVTCHALAGHAARHAQSDTQGAAYGLRSHPVYDGSSGVQPSALSRNAEASLVAPWQQRI